MGRRKNRARKRKNKASEVNIDLPVDILVEILSRLSLDSLARFTCVSKQWHRLISTISLMKRGSPKVLLASYSATHAFSPDSIDQHQQEACRKSLHIPWTRSDFVKSARCLGSCNELLLMGFDAGLFLWNPLTRFFKKVMAFDPLWMESSTFGLYYDSATDDHKVVIALGCDSSFLVVSFKNKSRTFIPFPYKKPKVHWGLNYWCKEDTRDSGPVVNAKLHWFVAKNDPSGERLSTHHIIYFDAHVDKFEEVPMPEPKRGDRDIILSLGALDGCLCISRRDGTLSNNIEVLVMKEYGVKNSWTSLFFVPDYWGLSVTDGPLVPLGFTKNGEVLAAVRSRWLLHDDVWLSDDDGCPFKANRWQWHIKAVNPIDNSHRSISKPKKLYFCPIAYEESLIAPSYDWEDVES